jgi:catechol 2,3-dioxygenase-like lactoylglutathione lyase family enzyme
VRQTIGSVTLLVPDYDEAIAYFVGTLGFSLVEDTPQGPGRRWVLVAPSGGGARLVLAAPSHASQAAHIGKQAGGRVFLFLHTDDFHRDYARMGAKGVRFVETPRKEPYGWVAVFEDRWGNRWDLLEPTPRQKASRRIARPSRVGVKAPVARD